MARVIVGQALLWDVTGRVPAPQEPTGADFLVNARVVYEEGDLDAVVDAELVEQAGHMGLDRRDGEVQSGRDLSISVAAADGEGDIELAWAQGGHEVAGVVTASARVGVAGYQGDEPSRDRGESIPSPAWTSSIARTISTGGVSFSR